MSLHSRRVNVPKVTKAALLQAFEILCDKLGVKSRGFDVEAITAPCDGPAYDGTKQWAMKYTKGCGWMIVCAKGGCGCALSRWNGYVQTRWNFLMLIEAVTHLTWTYEIKEKELRE